MAQHTPGPWKVEDPMHDILCVVVGGEPAEWRHVAQLALSDGDAPEGEARANARLIAAAPQLHALADHPFIEWLAAEGYRHLPEPARSTFTVIYEPLRQAALAKARGEAAP